MKYDVNNNEEKKNKSNTHENRQSSLLNMSSLLRDDVRRLMKHTLV